MSIFDTGSNSRGFGLGEDVCKEEGDGKKEELVGNCKEEELEVEGIKQESEVKEEGIGKK